MFSIFRTKIALQKGMEIVENVFTRYGLTLSRKKTETMVVNGGHCDTNSESIITLGNQKIKNVKEFKYLGVKIAPNNPRAMVEHRIASASSKFAEMKDVLTNHRINIKTRGKFMNAFIRTRLTYNCNTLFKATSVIKRLEVEWNRYLRRVVKHGMKRRNPPPQGISDDQRTEGQWDYAFIYSNKEIHKITGTKPIENFVEKQHLKWIAHVIRMDNSSFEKQTLFMEGGNDKWIHVEKITGLDRNQLRKIMFNKKQFDSWLTCLYK